MHDWWPDWTHQSAISPLYEGEKCPTCGVTRIKQDGKIAAYYVGKQGTATEPKCQPISK